MLRRLSPIPEEDGDEEKDSRVFVAGLGPSWTHLHRTRMSAGGEWERHVLVNVHPKPNQLQDIPLGKLDDEYASSPTVRVQDKVDVQSSKALQSDAFAKQSHGTSIDTKEKVAVMTSSIADSNSSGSLFLRGNSRFDPLEVPRCFRRRRQHSTATPQKFADRRQLNHSS